MPFVLRSVHALEVCAMQPDDEDDVPDDLACPITFSLMSDPVVRDYADTYTVPQPCRTYGVRVPAACAPYAPEAE